jgi:hypothetical protein
MVHSRLWLPRYGNIAREPYTLLLGCVPWGGVGVSLAAEAAIAGL